MISIIIPVYNLVSILNRCVNSVLDQSFSDWNLILVDDGSTDGSDLICDQFAQSDSRITAIHQQNMGAAGARNTGIREALKRETAYIIFLDGDDWWDSCLLEKMIARISQDGTLLAACGYIRVESDGSFSEFSIVPESPTIWNVQECYKNPVVIGTAPTRKLINSSLMKELEFPCGKLFEDEFFTYKLLYLAGRVSIVNEHLYYYYQRPGSLMHTPISAKGIGDKLDALYERESFFLEHGENELAAESKANALVANSKSIILAIQSGRYTKSEFPEQYMMTKLKALYYIRKYCSDDNYSYFLKKVYPRCQIIHEYLNKIKSLIQIR